MLFTAAQLSGAGVLPTLPAPVDIALSTAYRLAGSTACAQDSRLSRWWTVGSRVPTEMEHTGARAPGSADDDSEERT